MSTTSKAYLDTNLVVGIVKDDLGKLEADALMHLVKLYSESKLILVTSKVTEMELDPWQSDKREPEIAKFIYFLLEQIEFVADHTLLGFHNQWGPQGGVSYPLIEDNPISVKLRGLGLDRTDSHHVMLAIREKCDFFITCDVKSILKRRTTVETAFPSIRLMRPSEVIAEIVM